MSEERNWQVPVYGRIKLAQRIAENHGGQKLLKFRSTKLYISSIIFSLKENVFQIEITSSE